MTTLCAGPFESPIQKNKNTFAEFSVGELEWPAQSQDRIPNSHLWVELEWRLQAKILHLMNALQKESAQNPNSTTLKSREKSFKKRGST